MQPRLREFLHQLRQVGFTISTTELIAAHDMLLRAQSVDELRLGLRMQIVKSKQEQDLFDFIWNLFWSNSPETQQVQEEPDFPIQLPQGADADYCPNPLPLAMGQVGSNDPSVALIRFASDLKGSARQMIQGNYENAAAIFMRYLLAAKTNLGQLGLRREEGLREVKNMLQSVVPDHAEDLAAKLDKLVDKALIEQLSTQIRGPSQFKIQKTEELPIISLKPSPQLHIALQQLGKKLATRQKRKLRNRGRRINFRKTIRSNIQRGGVMLELHMQKRRLQKPRLVILTDISPSTIQATRMFLSIIWHAREVFSDIRFFEFIGMLIEVTPELSRARSIDEAIRGGLRRWRDVVEGKQNSDYYTAFRQFERLYGSKLTSRDTIILLGDLRDWLGPWREDVPLSAGVMGRLAKQAKRFIVLNPEPEASWDTGDSIVRFVKRYGIEVYETTTLQQLIDTLLKV